MIKYTQEIMLAGSAMNDRIFDAHKHIVDAWLEKIIQRRKHKPGGFTVTAIEIERAMLYLMDFSSVHPDILIEYSSSSQIHSFKDSLIYRVVKYVFTQLENKFTMWSRFNMDAISVGGLVVFKDTPAARRGFGDWPGYISLKDLEVDMITSAADHVCQ
jgi:hypothetical protein